MLTLELKSYLAELRGLSDIPTDAEIRRALFDAQWNDESIVDALEYFFELRTAAQAAAEPPVAPESEASTIPVLEAEPEVPPAQLPAGHSSQSVLYPDNSSQLGLKGVRMEPTTVAEPPAPVMAPIITPETPVSAEPPVAAPLEHFARPPLADIAFSSVDASPTDLPPVSESVPAPVVVSASPMRRAPQPPLARPPMRPGSIDGVRPVFVTKNTTPQYARGIRPPEAVRPVPTASPAAAVPLQAPPRARPMPPPRPVGKGRAPRLIARAGVLAVLLGIMAAVGYAYMAGIGPFASAGPYSEESFASDMRAGFAKLPAAAYTLTVRGDISERKESVVPLEGVLPAITFLTYSLSDALSFLPADARASATVSGSYRRTQGTAADFRADIRGTMSAGASSTDVRAELVRSGGVVFVNAAAVPAALLPDVSATSTDALLGSWVRVAGDASTAALFPSVAVAELASDEMLSRLTMMVARAADTEGLFDVVGAPSRIDSWRGDAYRYEATVRFERLPAVYRRMSNDMRTAGIPALLPIADTLAAAAAELERPAAAPFLAHLSSGALLTVDVAADGTPLSYAYRQLFSPGQSVASLQDGQILFSAELSLADVGPANAIAAPDEALSLEEAYHRMSGLSADEYRAVIQVRRVRSVAGAIDTFKQVSGRLPETLEELAKTGADVEPATEISDGFSYVRQYYRARSFIAAAPIDVYSGEQFSYVRGEDGAGYALTYLINLPPMHPEAARFLRDLYADSIDSSTGAVSQKAQVINGTNTLTADMLSVEAGTHR